MKQSSRFFRSLVASISVLLVVYLVLSTGVLLMAGASALRVLGAVACAAFFYYEAVAQIGAIKGIKPAAPVIPEVRCPPHRWEYDETGRMRCTLCKQRPLA